MKNLKLLSFAVCFILISTFVYGLPGGGVIIPPGLNVPTGAACPSPTTALQDDGAVSAFLCPDFENLGVGTTTPDINSKIHIVQTPEFFKYKPAIRVDVGTLDDRGAISAFQANGGTNFSTIQGTYEARIGFSQAFHISGHMIGGVLGVVRPSRIVSSSNAFATGAVSIADLDSLIVLNANVLKTWIGGSYSELRGTITSYPGINNGAVSAMIAIDNIKGTRTWAGYFDGDVRIAGNSDLILREATQGTGSQQLELIGFTGNGRFYVHHNHTAQPSGVTSLVNFSGNRSETILSVTQAGSGPAALFFGKVIIGQRQKTGAFADAMLQVDGKIVSSDDIIMMVDGWADYVLHPNYPLPDLLRTVKPHIIINQSLDGIPTTEEVIGKGLSLGFITKALVKKVEEIFLYLIEIKEEINAMMSDIFSIKKVNASQQNEINELKTTVKILTLQNEELNKKNIKIEKDVQEIKDMLSNIKKK
ncbi:MAG: hypothetical protein FVQ77_16350 [Cytophagales bacterium]|nr:hypothetical protein [Cytophagales bacterium]